jgi:katanin p60 ATPase-containing subunit A1
MGLHDLREKIKIKLNQNGVNTSDMDVMITCGANQAFMNTVLATCDEGDSAVILAPYYFSHKLALQLAGAKISICPFSQTTLKPDISQLRKLFDQTKPSLLVVTSPNNPSGLVFDDFALTELCLLCRESILYIYIYIYIYVCMHIYLKILYCL